MKIEWRKRAETELERASIYCVRQFGKRVGDKFFDAIIHQILLLGSNPSMGVVEPLLAHRRTMYRSLVVHKHYKLIYWVDENRGVLYISDLWDTRREPGVLAGRI